MRNINIHFRYVAQDIHSFFPASRRKKFPLRHIYLTLVWHFGTVAFKTPECHARSFPFAISDKEISCI